MVLRKVQVSFLLEEEAVQKINFYIEKKMFDSQANFCRRAVWEYIKKIEKPIDA